MGITSSSVLWDQLAARLAAVEQEHAEMRRECARLKADLMALRSTEAASASGIGAGGNDRPASEQPFAHAYISDQSPLPRPRGSVERNKPARADGRTSRRRVVRAILGVAATIGVGSFVETQATTAQACTVSEGCFTQVVIAPDINSRRNGEPDGTLTVISKGKIAVRVDNTFDSTRALLVAGGYGASFYGTRAHLHLVPSAGIGAPPVNDQQHQIGELFMDAGGTLYVFAKRSPQNNEGMWRRIVSVTA